jgi:preprotein translocase subunit SecA
MEGLDRHDLFEHLEAAAELAVDKVDLGPLDTFLVEDYPQRELAMWVSNRFGMEFGVDQFLDAYGADEAAAIVLEAAHTLYREREIVYPIDFAIDMTSAAMQGDPAKAISQFCMWAKSRYELDWTAETLPTTDPREIRAKLLEEARTWDAAKIAERASRVIAEVGDDVEEIDTWLRTSMSAALTVEEREEFAADPAGVLTNRIRHVMRVEVSQLEQWILLQILDSSWKEHLHQMDQLRESIGYRSFSQRDPRIEFKREGANLFEDMLMAIRGKVTDLVFKARLQPQVRQAQPTEQQTPQQPAKQAPQPQPTATPEQEAERSAVAAVAEAASTGRRVTTGERRKPSPAAAATGVVGRNEPCPCGSGKKFKKCCGAN